MEIVHLASALSMAYQMLDVAWTVRYDLAAGKLPLRQVCKLT